MKKIVLACSLVALTSCRETREAGIMLVIPSELTPPKDVDRVRIQVVHATRGEQFRTEIPTPLGETFPLSFGIGPSRSGKEGPYTFRVIGMLNGKAKTLSEAVADVPTTDVVTLTMPVDFLCYEKVRTLDDGQIIGLCDPGQTCIAGECKPIPVYKPQDLPPYVKPEARDAGASCYDTLKCFASPALLFADRKTCRVAKPAGAQNFTVGLILPPGNPGMPFQGKQLVVFDTDGPTAWRDAGAEVQLPTGICKILDTYPEATLVASTTCANKTSQLPPCPVSAPNLDASVPVDEAGVDATVPDVGLDAPAVGECEATGGAFLEAGTPCESGICNGAGRCGECRPGARRCSGKTLQACSAAGAWSDETECLTTCDEQGTGARCMGPCTPGGKQCKDDRTVQVCDSTGNYVDDVTCSYLCTAGTCQGTCSPAAKECQGSTLRTCNGAGQWVDQPCQYQCSLSGCTGECSPGNRRCSGSTPQTCTESGAWLSESPCPSACTGAGVCTICSPGAKECQGNTPRTCSESGSWVVGQPCSRTCTATGECESDNVACWGDNSDGQATPKAGTFTSVSAGGRHTCGVRADGTVDCWGDNSDGQATPKTGTFTSVSAGEHHTCGVRTGGAVDCWGLNYDDQATPKAGIFTSVWVGSFHTCGVRADGTVDCWGYNSDGQAVPTTGTFTSISAGFWYNCGVRPGGTVTCWGRAINVQDTPKTGTFISVSAGYMHACGVRTDQTVQCWGSNMNEEGVFKGQATPRAGIFTSVSAGHSHTCGVMKSP